jgi:AcrR family transcriptional regulator
MTEYDLILTEPQPSRSDALKNRALLLDTARRLFAEQGVEAVPMSAIAEAAGVGKGTLYRHFPNKTSLCEALLDDQQRDLQDRTLHRLRTHTDARENLDWFMREVLLFIVNNQPFLEVGVSQTVMDSLELPAHRWWRQTIRGLLGQMQLDGDLEFLSDTLYLLLDVRSICYLRHSRGYDVGTISDNLTRLVHTFIS